MSRTECLSWPTSEILINGSFDFSFELLYSTKSEFNNFFFWMCRFLSRTSAYSKNIRSLKGNKANFRNQFKSFTNIWASLSHKTFLSAWKIFSYSRSNLELGRIIALKTSTLYVHPHLITTRDFSSWISVTNRSSRHPVGMRKTGIIVRLII